jgi:hypothetical protein
MPQRALATYRAPNCLEASNALVIGWARIRSSRLVIYSTSAASLIHNLAGRAMKMIEAYSVDGRVALD